MPNITHRIFIFQKFDKELREIYISHAIRRFAVAMICIFEPIYLFLYFQKRIWPIFVYFGIVSLLYGLLVPLGAKLMTKIGLKKAMIWSVPIQFFYYLALWQISSSFFILLGAIILRILFAVFYWPAYHTDIARFSKKELRGEQIGISSIIYNLASVVGPIIGGFLVFKLGFSILFTIVLIILLLSIIPLLFSGEIHEVYYDSYKQAFQKIVSKRRIKDTLAFASFGIDVGISMFVWPVFLFILAINYETIGIVTSFSLFLNLIFIFCIGRIVDQADRKRLLSIGSTFTAFAWFLKSLVKGPLDAFLVYTFYRFASTSSDIPFRTIMYDEASRDPEGIDRFIVFREMSHNLGRAIIFFLLAVAFMFLPETKLYLTFLLAGGFALFFMLLGHREIKKSKTL